MDEPKAPAAAGTWEDLANEIVPLGTPQRGLATGAGRGESRPYPAYPDTATAGVGQRLAPPVAPRSIRCPRCALGAGFDTVLGGAEQHGGTPDAHYLIVRPATDYDPAFASLESRLQRVLELEKFPTLGGACPDDLLFVDIETTGLSADGPLFLIGALRLDSAPRLHLLLARHTGEERAVLAAFHVLAQDKTLITFNGKSFDWPYIRDRSIKHGLRHPTPRAHLDLLHHARRTWKHALPNCRLQTLELYLCGRTRCDDVASSRIPDEYQKFIDIHAATGRGAPILAPVVHHNALDILTLAELLCLASEQGTW